MPHYLPTDLRDPQAKVWGRESRAVLSVADSVTGCVLFVHGFNGASVGTWLEFPRLLPLETPIEAFDAMFFGYDGLRDAVAYSATQFGHLLEAVLTDPAARIVNPSLPRGADARAANFQYEQVLICAHSLGAVVARRALLDIALQAPPWHDRLAAVRLQFFAPAHKGARIIKLAEEGLAAISVPLAFAKINGKLAAVGLKTRYQVLQDLESGSQTLTDLEDDTRRILDRDPQAHTFLRAHVVHARRDYVVYQGQFAGDHWPEFIDGKGHMEVCKPELGFLQPLHSVLARVGGL